MTADVVKDRSPRQGLISQDILRGGRGGGSPCVKQRVHTRLPCRLPSLVVLNVIKKDLKREESRASYTTACGSREAESNLVMGSPSFTITA